MSEKPQKPNLKLSRSVKIMTFRKQPSNISCRLPTGRPPLTADGNTKVGNAQPVHTKKENIPLQRINESNRPNLMPPTSVKTSKSEVKVDKLDLKGPTKQYFE
uniref:Uncharacterized protein n=1 Tax=Graphocephala atropunctata TaxID=36148 RepID=A0A1B6KEP2_9HEMI